ncbi:DUF427 domain-containing protein [Ornithinimicrobium cerasi]|uniref:Uncharacterized conserved protein, DUF427 family n=1 Tax=Ornithinimicrobium cerasi TaxID=2248773 RepID=A0A285VI65_9MICO|nr:DUF427 domain-containing protein [Ornithinimicrobium cerasi]SOC52241.1 Uncharacterized conserved protein, DUF427 family [Ornithinimicrobium cerasi]
MAVDLLSITFDVLPQLRYAACEKRIRASRGGQPVADTTSALLVWEPRRLVPEYAVPAADLLVDLRPTQPLEPPDPLPPLLPPGHFGWHTTAGTPLALEGTEEEVAFRPDDPVLGGRVVLDFAAFDWVEEEEPVVGHPHDPSQRIDCLPSSRHVVVRLGGTVLAESRRPVALFETHLPPRWYLPREDVRMDLLTPSATTTLCAYKGRASYLSADVEGGADIAWSYPDPLHDGEPVRDLVCFWSERCEVTVDGRPVTERMPGL